MGATLHGVDQFTECIMQDHHRLYRWSNATSVFLASQYGQYLACLDPILLRIC